MEGAVDDLFEQILAAFDKAGLWRDGVELIGSWSFLLYQRHLGVRRMPLRTQDVDFLLPRPYPKRAEIDLGEGLERLGFRRAAATTIGSTYFLHPELKIEFLAPERGKGDESAWPVKALGVSAIPLRFMDMLLKDSITVKEGSAHVRVPSPLNFSLHKLLIAQRRKNKAKKERDIEQAVYVLEILEPERFRQELTDCPRKWRSLIEKSLKEAWDLLPLERTTLAKFGFAPQSSLS